MQLTTSWYERGRLGGRQEGEAIGLNRGRLEGQVRGRA